MYRKENVSARTRTIMEKERCFENNAQIVNIIFFIGKGFLLRKHIIVLAQLLYEINEHMANDMIGDLLSNGLLIKKQATDTKTCVYVMTKFAISRIKECLSRDAQYVHLNNRKLWNNFYRTEFIIRKVIPDMKNQQLDITLQSLLDYINENCITIFSTENQASIFQLYRMFAKNFPINNIEAILSGSPEPSYFMTDFYKAKAELYDYNTKFLEIPSDEHSDYSHCMEKKKEVLDLKTMINSPKDEKKYLYNLYNMVAAGFFFIGIPNLNGEMVIGTFDRCNNMTLKRIYENAIYIFYMLERYFGFCPHITLNVYISDMSSLESLEKKEKENAYNYDIQEKSEFNKRDNYFKNLDVPEEYWEYINVKYIYYPLREKYNI